MKTADMFDGQKYCRFHAAWTCPYADEDCQHLVPLDVVARAIEEAVEQAAGVGGARRKGYEDGSGDHLLAIRMETSVGGGLVDILTHNLGPSPSNTSGGIALRILGTGDVDVDEIEISEFKV